MNSNLASFAGTLQATRLRLLSRDAFVNVDGIDVAVRALGVGSVVVLCAAGAGQGEVAPWRDFVDPFVLAICVVLYNLFIATVAGVPWRRPPTFALFALDWVVASSAIVLTGGLFSPFILLYYALGIGAALRLGISQVLSLVTACAGLYVTLSLVLPEPVAAVRLPLLAVTVSSLLMVVLTALGMKRVADVEARRAQLEGQATQHIRLLNSVTTSVLSGSPDLRRVMRSVAEASSQALGADSGLSVLSPPVEGSVSAENSLFDRESILLVADRDPNPPRLSDREWQMLLRVARTRQAVIESEEANAPRQNSDRGFPGLEHGGAQLCAVACVPLLLRDEVIGALFVGRKSQQPFTPSDVTLLTALGQQMAVAVRLARLYDAEREKAQLFAEREQLERDLLSMVSHELRTPLTSIKTCVGALATLEESTQSTGDNVSTQLRMLQNIDRSAGRLTNLVNELLDTARLRAGRVSLQRQQINVGEVIEEAVSVVLPLYEARRQRVTLDLPHRTSVRWGKLNLIADKRRIEQVLVNLLANANKYAPDLSEITIGATPRAGNVTIFVRDSGPGVKPGMEKQIFERFYRAEETADERENPVTGTGLGLAIARSIVELHGGRISVTSRSGQGSTFFFTLPQGIEGRDEYENSYS